MNSDIGQSFKRGGTVEPANRAAVAAERFQKPVEAAGERYELRDPFAEVTYRSKTLDEITAKADQLGAMRVHAVDDAAKRTAIEKTDGTWKRLVSPLLSVAKTPEPPDRASDVRPAAAPPIASARPDVASVDADAERAARTERIEAALLERYVIKRAAVKIADVSVGQTEYRYRGDTSRVAFTETTFRLATDNNSPSVARSMVDVAEARNWKALRVSGHEDFRRMVWLEASLRGVKTIGYEPQPADQEVLRRERESRLVNRIEPTLEKTATSDNAAPGKQSARGSGGRKAVLATLEAVLVAKGVSPKQRDAVMAAATENLAQRLRQGETHKVKVYDRSAPSERPAVAPVRERQRTLDRGAPVR